MSAPSPCDQVFEALNGRQLRVRGTDWRVDVYGVFETDRNLWVQLILQSKRPRVVTLHMESTQTPGEAVRSLRQWLTDPSDTRDVLLRLAPVRPASIATSHN